MRIPSLLLVLLSAGIARASDTDSLYYDAPSGGSSEVNGSPQIFDGCAVTVASNGAGTPAAATLTPACSYVELTCNDTDGCTMTMGETGVHDGQWVRVVNVAANAATFSNSAAVSQLNGNFTMRQWQGLDLQYTTDRWVEQARQTGNSGAAPYNIGTQAATTHALTTGDAIAGGALEVDGACWLDGALPSSSGAGSALGYDGLAGAVLATDVAPSAMTIHPQDNYPGGAQTASGLFLSGGLDETYYTIVDYTLLAGKTFTVDRIATGTITSTVLTEGTSFSAVTSNSQTATNLAAAINALSGVVSVSSAAKALVSPKMTTTAITLATNAAAGGATATNDPNTAGFVTITGKRGTLTNGTNGLNLYTGVALVLNGETTADTKIYLGTGGAVTFQRLGTTYLTYNGTTAAFTASATTMSGSLAVGGGTAILKHLSATASLNFGVIAAGVCAGLTITVTGAADGDTVDAGIPNALASTANLVFDSWVSAADTVTVRACCTLLASSCADPAAATVRADVWQH